MLTGLAHVRRLMRGHLRRIGALAVLSTVSGLIQVLVLVIIVNGALALSGGETSISIDAGPLGLSAPVAQALGTGVALVALLLLTAYLSARLSAATSADILTRERQRLLLGFLGAAPLAQSRGGGGVFQETATAYTSRAAQVGSSVAGATVASLNLGVLLVGALLLDVVAAVAVLVGVSVLAGMAQPLARKRKRAVVDQAATSLQYAEAVGQLFATAREVRTFAVMPEVTKEVEATIARTTRPYYRVQALNRFVPTAFQYSGFALLLVALALLSTRSADSLTSVGSVLLIVLRSFAYAQTLQLSLQSISESAPYCLRLEGELARYVHAAEPDGGEELGVVTSLQLRGAAVVYDDGRQALQDVNLELRAGECLGVVGPSGSGKSTLSQVLLRLVPLAAGELKANDRRAESFSTHSWHSRIAFVPQEAVLISGTVADNIRFHRSALTDEDVLHAARAAGVLDELLALPQGVRTLVGHGGVGLSGGQRQRVCIARALAARPSVLILDEPTSALDVGAALVLHRTLESLRGSVTMMIISHQPETVDFCDRLVQVSSGRVTELKSRPGSPPAPSRPAERTVSASPSGGSS